MKALLLLLFVHFVLLLQAQYYYKDIIGTSETAALIARYKTAQITRVNLASFDADNTRSEDFAVQQQFDAAKGTLRTSTQAGNTDASVLWAYTDAEGRVIKTVDSSASSISTTSYAYGPNNLLAAVTALSSDLKGSFQLREDHLWQYDGNNRISGMLRVRNGKDTTHVTFVVDEQGQITEEHARRNNIPSEPVYYYYNGKNQLTDIVRFNNKAKRLLPEYMFEYNDKGQVIQRITFPQNSSEYTIWRYQYDNRGLRTREAVYNKQKQLTGKIEYSYL